MRNKTLIWTSAAIVVVAVLAQLSYLSSRSVSQLNESPQVQAEGSQYSYTDILENDEFRREMQDAVVTNDLDKAKELQQKALEIADAANLPKLEVQLLSGEKGLQFMQFNAKRQLFVKGVEQRYKNLQQITDLKQRYPEAEDLFARSDALIASRDQTIRDIAEQLADGNDGDYSDYIALAKKQWLELNNAEVE